MIRAAWTAAAHASPIQKPRDQRSRRPVCSRAGALTLSAVSTMSALILLVLPRSSQRRQSTIPACRFHGIGRMRAGPNRGADRPSLLAGGHPRRRQGALVAAVEGAGKTRPASRTLQDEARIRAAQHKRNLSPREMWTIATLVCVTRGPLIVVRQGPVIAVRLVA